MKLSVSLPADDVAFLDQLAVSEGFGTRSAALHEAVRALRTSSLAAQLSADYERAWDEWLESGDEGAWATVSADGIVP